MNDFCTNMDGGGRSMKLFIASRKRPHGLAPEFAAKGISRNHGTGRSTCLPLKLATNLKCI